MKLPMTLDAEQEHMLSMSMPQLLDHAAERWPDNDAIVFIEGSDVRVTWSQFRDDVVRLRSGLDAAGVRAGEKIGLLLHNQYEFPLSWFAVGALGAVVVPLNPKYTPREIEFVLADAGATWLIGAADTLSAHVGDTGLGPVSVDHVVAVGGAVEGALSFTTLMAGEPQVADFVPEPDDLVNIQFTSGTTGLPKGCMLTHRYWVELGVYGSALFHEARRTLADHAFYYMQNQAYLASAMCVGGAIYVTQGLSRRKFMDWLVDHQIDMAWIDEGMLDFPESDADRRLALKRAPVMAVPKELHAALEKRFDLQARDLYASTELGNGTVVPWDRVDMVGSGSMGLCFPNRESKLVDADLNEVEPGEIGELCMRGRGIMLGYHNRPEVNAELFLPGGWFRTGDLVRKDAEGFHFYVGRTRDIIRRSGESIAAGEVEGVLEAMPQIDDVAVIAVPDASRDEEVKAIVVLADDVAATPEEVVAWARRGLAPFKLPRYVEFRDELPYTGSGKIAKGALRDEEPFGPAVTDVLGPGPRR
ncbi:MAG: class I adenylate-forming enzyme family protein [Nocardioides sp.]|uniref:class I adenylate-forming enzyme family protein n=1 Tax=Nocardioides sp. TaxID=35761 RepID=UPI0039E537CE